MISGIRYRYSIPSPQLKQPTELTVKEVAQKFGIGRGVVYYWIQNGYLEARRIQDGYPYWITLNSEKEKDLRDRINVSDKLKHMVG